MMKTLTHFCRLTFALLTMMTTDALSSNALAKPLSINYTLSFEQAQAHYVHVVMRVGNLPRHNLNLKMPVWTPGSYLVREFAKSVEGLKVSAPDGKPVYAVKTNKSTWHINCEGHNEVEVAYDVYGFELSVRTSYIDADQGFVSTSGVLLYPEGMLHNPSTVKIVPYKGWSKVTTSLATVNGDEFTRYAPDYDILFDSPIQVGNQDVFDFDVQGAHYQVAMCGPGKYDKARIAADLVPIVNEQIAVFGEDPNKHYVFIVHNAGVGGGGLEHLSSCVLGVARDAYATEAGYKSFLTLCAHEHFHVWNVKRLRPFTLGPFNYDAENYTPNLWVAEGFTSYYQNQIMRRAGFNSVDAYLAAVAGNINLVENTPGNKIQSASEASLDAWIKYYRPTENSNNSTVSYYNKGSIIATLLDLMINAHSQGKQSLDDAMRYAYQTFYHQKKRGYTDAEFKEVLEQFTGQNLDDFYKRYINGTDDIPYDYFFALAGYQFQNSNAGKTIPYIGARFSGSLPTVNSVDRNSPAWKQGLNVGDQIIDVDDIPLSNIDAYIAKKHPGDELVLHINRDGLPRTITLTVTNSPMVRYVFSPVENASPEQLAVRKKWLKL